MNLQERVNGWIQSARQFFHEVRVELRKVSWPSRDEVVGTTAVVVGAVFFFGLYLGLVDLVLSVGLNRILMFFGTTGG